MYKLEQVARLVLESSHSTEARPLGGERTGSASPRRGIGGGLRAVRCRTRERRPFLHPVRGRRSAGDPPRRRHAGAGRPVRRRPDPRTGLAVLPLAFFLSGRRLRDVRLSVRSPAWSRAREYRLPALEPQQEAVVKIAVEPERPGRTMFDLSLTVIDEDGMPHCFSGEGGPIVVVTPGSRPSGPKVESNPRAPSSATCRPWPAPARSASRAKAWWC